MFVTIESQFDRHGNLWFGLTSSVINIGIMCESAFWCKRSPIKASIIQKTAPKARNMLVMSPYFATVQSECFVRGRSVIPNSLAQLTKSVLRKAVPLSCIIEKGTPK